MPSTSSCRVVAQLWCMCCRFVPTAVLSRQTAGLRGKSLIINLPGKPKSIRETFDEVGGSLSGAAGWCSAQPQNHAVLCRYSSQYLPASI